MVNVSSAMGGQFAWTAAELTEEIRRMGPNPLKNNGQAHNDRVEEEHPQPGQGARNDGEKTIHLDRR